MHATSAHGAGSRASRHVSPIWSAVPDVATDVDSPPYLLTQRNLHDIAGVIEFGWVSRVHQSSRGFKAVRLLCYRKIHGATQEEPLILNVTRITLDAHPRERSTMDIQPLPGFMLRRNRDLTHDAICLHCHLLVSVAWRPMDLYEGQARHVCGVIQGCDISGLLPVPTYLLTAMPGGPRGLIAIPAR
jgi:hypothetical protein